MSYRRENTEDGTYRDENQRDCAAAELTNVRCDTQASATRDVADAEADQAIPYALLGSTRPALLRLHQPNVLRLAR